MKRYKYAVRVLSIHTNLLKDYVSAVHILRCFTVENIQSHSRDDDKLLCPQAKCFLLIVIHPFMSL